MKTCSVCNKDKDESQFHWRSVTAGTRKSACKDCTKLSDAEKYKSGKRGGSTKEQALAIRRRNSEFVRKFLSSSSCVDCGETDIRVLEFDHLGDKEYNVSQMGSYSLARLQLEISKCEVVCANHHRIRTYSRMESCWRTAPYPSG